MPVPVPECEAKARREHRGHLLMLLLLAQREVHKRVQLAKVLRVSVVLHPAEQHARAARWQRGHA